MCIVELGRQYFHTYLRVKWYRRAYLIKFYISMRVIGVRT